jgi:aspartate/methionine/tyrosine aminotransferase
MSTLQSLSVWMIFLLSTRLPTSRSFLLETAKSNNLYNQVRAARTRSLGNIILGHCANDKASGGMVGRQPQKQRQLLSMVTKPTDTDHGDTGIDRTVTDGVVGGFPLSNKIVQTLDPCVVKTKEWMGNYAHLWEGDSDSDRARDPQQQQQQQQQGIFSLAQGVVYWKPPPSCRKALVDAVTMGGEDPDEENEESDPLALHSYSPARGLPELIHALETKIEIEHGMTDHDVTVTVGANQAYTNIVLTLLGGSGTDNNNNNINKAVVFAPYYFNHVMAIQMCAGPEAVVVGPTDMTTGVPDIDWLERTLSEHENQKNGTNSIRMVTLVNPGNPTGVALSRETVKEIVDLCKEYGVWVVLDCTYEHFFNTGDDGDGAGERVASPNSNPNPLPTFPDDSHVVHVFSFSKGYAMAGYRCGYLVTHKNDASKGEFLSQMLKVQDTIPIGPPRLSQHVALGALRQGAVADSSPPELYCPSSKEWVYQKYATLDASRSYILEALSSLPQKIGGSGSMYVMGKLPDDLTITDTDNDGGEDDEPTDVLFCRLLVRDYGIAIIPGSFCGFPGWIRVCYANLLPEKTKVAAERLRKGIEDLTGQT